jgi:hypothetical protein
MYFWIVVAGVAPPWPNLDYPSGGPMRLPVQHGLADSCAEFDWSSGAGDI